MASLWKHPKSKFWFACITLPGGKRTKRTTKHTDRKQAQLLANQWESMTRSLITATNARRIIADIYKQNTGETLSHFTVRSYFAQWAKRKAPEVDPNTAEKYQAAVTEFCEFLGERADWDLLRLTLEDLHGFRDSSSQKSSPKTTNNKLVILSQAVKTAWKDNHIAEDIAGRIGKLKLQGKQLKKLPFTNDQVRQIFKTAKGEWMGMVLFGYYTGQRLGDIASLTWRDIDETTGVLKITSKKRSRVTHVPLARPLAKWVKKNASARLPDSTIFPAAAASMKKNSGKTSALSKQFRVLLVDAGLATRREWQSQGKGRSARREVGSISFHSFRHTLTSEIKNLGGGAAITQDIVGHDSTAVSEQYTHVNDTVKRQYLEQLPDITKPSEQGTS